MASDEYARAKVTRQETAPREGTAQPADVKGNIVSFLFCLKKEGYAKDTIRGTAGALRALQKEAQSF